MTRYNSLLPPAQNFRIQDGLRSQIRKNIPTYIDILDRNIKGELTVPDPGDWKDEEGNYKPSHKRRRVHVELSTSKLRSIEILLSRALPTLLSTEHTQLNPIEEMSQEQLLDRLKELMKQRPELAEKLFEAQTVKVEEKTVEDKPLEKESA